MTMRFLIAALLSATTLPAGAGAPTTAFQPVYTVTRLGTSTMQVICGARSNQDCHYLILKSLCQERLTDDGGKEKTCRYMEAAPPFRLAPGEKKTVANLPSDFIYTMKSGKAPTAAETLAAPIAH
jgi:hypothetical protein